MAPDVQHRQYYPGKENTPLSVAVREALEEFRSTYPSEDEFALYDHIDPDALENLFVDTEEVGIIVQFHLTNAIVSIWSNGAIDICVTDDLPGQRPE